MPATQLKLKIRAADAPLTVIVEPLGWDYTLAPEQSAWFVVEAYDESGHLEVSSGGARYVHPRPDGATGDEAWVLVDDVGEVQFGFDRLCRRSRTILHDRGRPRSFRRL